VLYALLADTAAAGSGELQVHYKQTVRGTHTHTRNAYATSEDATYVSSACIGLAYYEQHDDFTPGPALPATRSRPIRRSAPFIQL